MFVRPYYPYPQPPVYAQDRYLRFTLWLGKPVVSRYVIKLPVGCKRPTRCLS